MSVGLVILAAGMGSRYGGGGVKQVAKVDPDGCFIIDYSIYDAAAAGITDITVVIKKEMENEINETIGKRVSRNGNIRLSYAFQDIMDIPAGFTLPEGRVKPWGTCHAVWAARHVMTKPFITINADDFYGRNAYITMAKSLESLPSGRCLMAGYALDDTLPPEGAVSRAICASDSENRLLSLAEHTDIHRTADGAQGTAPSGETVNLPLNSLTSLNMYGFRPDVFPMMERGFTEFMEISGANNNKAEFYLPGFVDGEVKSGRLTAILQPVKSKWHGITFQRDLEEVCRAISNYKKQGLYPERLWDDV